MPPTPENLYLAGTSGPPVPLGFVRDDDTVFLVARERSAAWPVAILRDGVADLRWPGGGGRGEVELVSDPLERSAVLTRFLDKYGAERFARWYEHPARVLRVRLGTQAAADGPGSERYYGWLSAEFDNVAADYDRHITGNRMNRLLRDRSLAWLRPLFKRSPHLLEIGCGSGMETIPLLTEGHEIAAVDISERMLEVVRGKAKELGLSERLSTHHVRARDLSALLPNFGPGAFDGAYSTYGALNCEPDLTSLAPDLHALLAEDASFVAGVYNRWCLFEIVGYSLTFQWGRALGRRRNPVPVGASRFCVDVYAHSAGDFERLMAPEFRPVRVEGVPVLLPPSDLTSYAEKFGRHFPLLARLDARAGKLWPLNRLGDHFLMTFRRNGAVPSPSLAVLRPS
ncbi:MAG: methyltransferase domain-containing protein [Thermoplasmata archaeon]|nr:methyltransferase domain-containing protein [Thermoplasmata archaeon]